MLSIVELLKNRENIVNENGIIISDEWKPSNRGKKFENVYDVELWN